MPEAPSARARLAELFAKLEAFFAKVKSQNPGAIACREGCADCCRRRFSVTGLEAEVIASLLASLPRARRDELAARAEHDRGEACAALDPDGRCAIYEARPILCRSHGLPIRFPPQDRRSLPLVDACPKNFEGRDLGTLDAASVLDQTTLSTILAALDAAHADETERPRGERIALSTVLARGGLEAACTPSDPKRA